MNKQQRQNVGLSITFIVIASIMALILIGLFFIGENSFRSAPIGNKLLAAVFAGGAVYYAIGWSKDKWFNSVQNDKVWLALNTVCFIVLLLMALLILGVFHSGPLGTTTNPL